MTPPVRPLRLTCDADLDGIAQHVQAALDAWARQWLCVPSGTVAGCPPVQARTARRPCAPDGPVYDLLSTEAGSLWVRSHRDELAALCRAVVGTDQAPDVLHTDRWITRAVDLARDARNRALYAAGVPLPSGTEWRPVPDVELPDHLFDFASGAVQLTCDAIGLFALADDDWVRSRLPVGQPPSAHRLPDPAPLNSALSRSSVHLDIVLEGVELELGQLLDLRAGDVLTLPHPLDQPLWARCGGAPMARAVLGQDQGRVCVQLTPIHQ